jgi:hypothetical protein
VAPSKIFLLSPAHTGGERGRLLFSDRAAFPLATEFRREGAPLADVYSFISGLYFRGKVAYARAFAAPPPGAPASLVITPGRGLLSPETRVTLDELRQIASVPIDAADPRYRIPLERDARALAGVEAEIILLGSVATLKYLGPLFEIFGQRLLYPVEFAGRGDMSRGGLLLRSARAGVELTYAPAGGATRHGSRPPRLPSTEPRP